ncbi:MAG: UDP-glucose 4-epimerase GalE [Sulfuricaulis sp.]
MSKQKILVVGGAGYIGSHMVLELLRANYDVVILDNLVRGHRELIPGGTLFEGNLGDRKLLNSIFSQHQIDAVMHFAAFSLVGESVKKPLAYYRNNVSCTIELLEAMEQHQVWNFIFSSTAAVYGEPIKTPITEEHPCLPTNPYGESKQAVENLLADCALSGHFKYISLRYFNAAGADISGTLGERHEPETHLIPLVLQVASGQRNSLCIFGTDYPTDDGTCIRDYVHVSDLTQAHMLALNALITGSDCAVYNLGNSKGYSVQQVIELARQITGHSIPTVTGNRRPGDPAVLIADSSKIRHELGWQPRYEDLRAIIETAWVWHQHETKITPRKT